MISTTSSPTKTEMGRLRLNPSLLLICPMKRLCGAPLLGVGTLIWLEFLKNARARSKRLPHRTLPLRLRLSLHLLWLHPFLPVDVGRQGLEKP